MKYKINKEYTIDLDGVKEITHESFKCIIHCDNGELIEITAEEETKLKKDLKQIKVWYINKDDEVRRTNAHKMLTDKRKLYSKEETEELLEWIESIKTNDIKDGKKLLTPEALVKAEKYENILETDTSWTNLHVASRELNDILCIPERDWKDLETKKALKMKNTH